MNWLKLAKDTFVWLDSQSALLFNPEAGKHLLFAIETPEVDHLLRSLADPYKLTCVNLHEELAKNEKIRYIVDRITESGLGQTIQASDPPVSYPPQLNLQCDTFRALKDHGLQEEVFWNSYLKGITLYLTGDITENDIARQELYPLEGDSILPISPVLDFVQDCLNIGLKTISICAIPGRYPYESQLFDFIGKAPVRRRLFIRAKDFVLDDIKRYEIFDEITLIYYKDFDSDAVVLQDTDTELKARILVDNENDCQEYLRIIEGKEKDGSISLSPLFNGYNEKFFCDNVLLSHSEILEQQIEKRIIFARQRANLNRFGLFSIFPNGNVYSNVFEEPTGTINDSIQTLIAREMRSNKGWLEIRDNSPCSQCVGRWLCPSPTSQERLMNRLACVEGKPLTARKNL